MENHPGALADQQIPQRVRMSAKEFEAKFSTKRECFSFLTIDCKAYLPAYDTVTIYFLKDLIAGRKKFLRSHQCRHLQVPQYKSLKVERLQQFISNYPDTFIYYPDECEIAKLPKQWLVNVAYSILDDLFANWVKEQIEERNARVAEKGNLMIELDSEVHQAFLESSAVSLQKGASANMLKIGTKRRRTQAQIKAEKEEARLREQDLQEKLARMAELQQKEADYDRMLAQHEEASGVLSKLHAEGLIDVDEEGKISPSKRKLPG